MRRDTIVALSSGAGRSAVAVIRISGPQVRFVLEICAGGVPLPRQATLCRLIDAAGSPIDDGLVLFFPAPRSYTGEDLAEWQVHGGPAVVRSALACLTSLPGLRLAEAGEFTRRALENGRLDLARVEGIADLIDAETPRQQQQALAQAGGLLSRQALEWRETLLEGMAQLEAQIDFSDEGDVDAGESAAVLLPLRQLQRDLAAVLAGARRGEILREGLRVVIAGPPNAGKSTLLNALARRDVAIVSDIPGTTRDVLDVHLDLDGYPLVVSDTAGMRETSDPLEALGVERATARAESADVVLWLSPAGQDGEVPSVWADRAIRVATKIDSHPNSGPETSVGISARTGEGLDALLDRLKAEAERLVGREPLLVTRERHRLAIENASTALGRALTALENAGAVELAAEDLRLASRALGSVIGLVDVEQVLDRLFSSFCIGK